MKEIYKRLQQEAIRIAGKYPPPDFYADFAEEIERSQRFFNTDSAIGSIYEYVAGTIEDDYGHGIDHVREVALDAGALTLIEGGRLKIPETYLIDRLRLAQCAGLLHDIRRKAKKHAEAGAIAAREILCDYKFSEDDVADICLAIRNHEAFGENNQSATDAGSLLSDSLYDGDKFRWGPENFTRTIWGMVSFLGISVDQFLEHYPRGMAFLSRIRSTFRTPTGKAYGPQFIDLGLAIGNDLYEQVNKEL